MSTLFEEFNKIKKEVRLEPDQKNLIRGNLLRFIEADLALKERPKQLFSFGYFSKAPALATLMIMVLAGGGTSLAAEGTLPGDILYPIKTAVNEPIVSALSLGVEAKADWEVELASRRLKEAVKLAEAGKLDESIEAKLSSEFEKHQQKTQEQIFELENEGNEKIAASIAARFEGSLKAHEEALARLEDSDTGVVSLAQASSDMAVPEIATMSMKTTAFEETKLSIKDRVTGARIVTADTRVRLESRIKPDNGSSTERAVEAKIEAASEMISRTKNLIEKEKSKLNKKSSFATEVQLKASQELIREAKTKSEGKLFGEAFSLVNQAIRDAQESKTATEIRSESVKKSGSERLQKDEKNDRRSSSSRTFGTTTPEKYFIATSSILIKTSSSERLEVKAEEAIEIESKKEDELLRSLEDRIKTRFGF